MAKSLPRTLTAFLRLTRVWNLLIIVLAQYAVVWFLLEPEPDRALWIFGKEFFVPKATILDPLLLILSASTCLVAAAGYVINDYFDVKIDLINKPNRVVVGRQMSRRKAIAVHIILSGTGVAFGLAVNWKVAALNLVSAILLWWYSAKLKRGAFFGNLVISLLTAFSLLVICLLYEQWPPAILLYALFAFFMTMVREAVKDMEDVRGDQAFGCRTLPIRWGIAATKIYTGILVLLLVGSVVIAHLVWLSLPVNYFLALVLLPLGIFSYRLMQADTVREFHRLSQWCKYILILGVLSMAML